MGPILYVKKYVYTKSFGGKLVFRKKISLLAKKLFLEKNVCAFESCLVMNRKYTKSFGGKNLPLRLIFPLKSISISSNSE